MKNLVFTLILMILLVGCGTAGTQDKATVPETVLTIINGDKEQPYTVTELQEFPSVVSSFEGKEYMGVSVKFLLEEARVNINDISAVKAVATDGYSVNYEPAQLLPDDVLVAYSLADGGSMASDEGKFRMVLPDQEGNQNLRLLYKLVIIP